MESGPSTTKEATSLPALRQARTSFRRPVRHQISVVQDFLLRVWGLGVCLKRHLLQLKTNPGIMFYSTQNRRLKHKKNVREPAGG
jgi:hypothetical protein